MMIFHCYVSSPEGISIHFMDRLFLGHRWTVTPSLNACLELLGRVARSRYGILNPFTPKIFRTQSGRIRCRTFEVENTSKQIAPALFWVDHDKDIFVVAISSVVLQKNEAFNL